MRLIDLYYRAFRAYRKQTENDPNSQKERKVIKQTNKTEDQLTSIKQSCHIDEDWIENIEEGLIHVEKAIREERQFIRTEGEVVPIEKAKRTSKATIQHLARHSGFITHLPKKNGDPLVPDKLYIVEKLSDYAVYENKFLYMLLCYLRDFVNIRIDKIRDKMTTYQSNMTMNKEIKMNNRHINYHLVFSDLYKNDPYLISAYQQIPLVNRIETIYFYVTSLLSTPLMMEVSKSPMIKPPVVKTNVLRMNPNFQAALQLYDYITSYFKDGYSFAEVKKTYNPFHDEMSDEMAETIELTSFLSYKFGNDIIVDLKEVYESEDKKIIEQENQKKIEQLKRLKKRITELNEDPGEYILTLEKRNRSLEKESSELGIEKEKNAEYKLQITSLENEQNILKDTISNMHSELRKKNDAINTLNKKYFDDMTTAEQIHRQEMAHIIAQTNQRISNMQESHQKAIFELNEKQRIEIMALNEKYQKERNDILERHNLQMHELINQYTNEKEQLQQRHESEQQELVTNYEEKIHGFKAKIQEVNQNNENLQMEKQQLTSHCDELISNHEQSISMQKSQYEDSISMLKLHHEDSISVQKLHYENQIKELDIMLQRYDDEKKHTMGKFLALKQQQGLITNEDDFTSKERFKELELEMIAFKKLFKEQWKKTKIKIREEAKRTVKMSATKEDSCNNNASCKENNDKTN